jgi:hypothetical protein
MDYMKVLTWHDLVDVDTVAAVAVVVDIGNEGHCMSALELVAWVVAFQEEMIAS